MTLHRQNTKYLYKLTKDFNRTSLHKSVYQYQNTK